MTESVRKLVEAARAMIKLEEQRMYERDISHDAAVRPCPCLGCDGLREALAAVERDPAEAPPKPLYCQATCTCGYTWTVKCPLCGQCRATTSVAEAPPAIDVGMVRQSKWTASNYLDTDECGIIADDNAIVIPLRSGLPRELCERIAADHNAALAAQPEVHIVADEPMSPELGKALGDIVTEAHKQFSAQPAKPTHTPDISVVEIAGIVHSVYVCLVPPHPCASTDSYSKDSVRVSIDREAGGSAMAVEVIIDHAPATQPAKSDIRTAWDRDTPYWRCRAELAEAVGLLDEWRSDYFTGRFPTRLPDVTRDFLARHATVANTPHEIAMDGIKDEPGGREATT